MTPERFETLAEAFGGDVSRWPEAEREAAAEAMAAQPAWAERVLAAAGALDAALAAFPPPRASGDLAERIAATAPRARAAAWVRWLLPVGMGAGLAAACAAGVVAGGRFAATVTTPANEADPVAAAIADYDAGVYLDEEA